jgi:putative ABC transport system ATP-binding protein
VSGRRLGEVRGDAQGRSGEMGAPEKEPSKPAGSAALLRTCALVKTYRTDGVTVQAVRGIDIELAVGEFVAIMGPSGSGKSTLMHCLAGLEVATSGSVRLDGTELTGLPDKQLTLLRRERVGFIFQSFNLLPALTAEQNIRLPLDLAGRRADPRLWDLVIGQLGLADRLKHRPGEMSGGQQQRVACARALITKPDVIFADEPTGNLDSVSGAEVLSFLRSSVRELGQTVIMVTHDQMAASYADRVVTLADGRVTRC